MALTQVPGTMILASGQSIPKAALPTGSVLQVVSTFKSDTTSATSAATKNTWADITGMSVSVTPTSSTSKILILFSMNISANDGESVAIQLVRGSTAIGNGDASSNKLSCFTDTRVATNSKYEFNIYSGLYLDSPATTSATTYKIQWQKPYDNGSTPIYLNRSYDDSVGTNERPRGSSTITVMEIAA